MNPAERAAAVEPGSADSPWDGHEFGRGYAVLTLPFSSGDILGLRVFPRNDFAPYVSVWHRPRTASGRSMSTGRRSRPHVPGTGGPRPPRRTGEGPGAIGRLDDVRFETVDAGHIPYLGHPGRCADLLLG